MCSFKLNMHQNPFSAGVPDPSKIGRYPLPISLPSICAL